MSARSRFVRTAGGEACTIDRDTHRRDVQRRRRSALAIVAGLALLVGLVTGAGGGSSSDGDSATAQAPPAPTLPGGGRSILPGRMVVALCGAPQDDGLGALGIGSPDQAGRKLLRQAAAYRTRRIKVLPAMQLIATVVNRDPGDDGQYRTRQTDAVIRRYLKAARKVKAILILDIQPGRADFLTETKVLEKWLREPDVSLALDPEWHMAPGQVPGQAIGSVTAAEVNSVSTWLSGIVRRGRLPQKLMVVHQFTPNMIKERQTLQRPAGVMPVLNVDGFGGQADKRAKYQELAQRRLPNGFKLFYHEDTGLFAPGQVRRLTPAPRFVVYE